MLLGLYSALLSIFVLKWSLLWGKDTPKGKRVVSALQLIPLVLITLAYLLVIVCLDLVEEAVLLLSITYVLLMFIVEIVCVVQVVGLHSLLPLIATTPWQGRLRILKAIKMTFGRDIDG